MIKVGAVLRVADNSGAKLVCCIKVLASKGFAAVGDVIVVSIKKAIPRGKVMSGTVALAVIVRTKKGKVRSDGSCVCFGDNAVVLINKQHDFIGSRVFGAVDAALRFKKFTRVLSLAPEVV
jgi:large subunit ribosomal protein L14